MFSWGLGASAALVGFSVAASLPASARPALLFANTLYFALLIGADLVRPAARPAVIGGMLAAPIAMLLPPAQGLLLAGLIGGTAAWMWQRR
jgi:predicted branched-subunit amino acid permease